MLVAGVGWVSFTRGAGTRNARGVHRQPRGERRAADPGERAQASERLIVKNAA